MEEGTRFQVLAPVVRGRKGEYVDLFADLQTKGFARARVDGVVHPLTEPPKLKKQEKHTIEVVVDRLAVEGRRKQRLTDSVETALGLAGGIVLLDFVDLPEDDAAPRAHASPSTWPAPTTTAGVRGARAALVLLQLALRRLPGVHRPRHQEGGRPRAGRPRPGAQPARGRDRSRGPTGHDAGVLPAAARGARRRRGLRPRHAVGALPSRAQKAILHGSDDQVHVRYSNRYGRERSYYAGFEGVVPFIERAARRHRVSDWSRDKYEGYMRDVPCPACGGTRLKPEILAVTHRRPRASPRSAPCRSASAPSCSAAWSSTDRQKMIAERVLKEINARLRFLVDVGLDYLSLDRPAGTLSGGEAQRIRLATQIGSGLVGVLYVLDEPSIGLHQRDNHRLIETLIRLRDLGNTLIVVEHDEDTIRTADWVVDIGPGAGEHGGEIVLSGTVDDLLASEESITGAYLSGRAVDRDARRCAGRRRPAASWSCRAPASTTCAT